MITIEIDEEVFEMLGKIAKPFVETSPNMVIRRILGLEPEKPDDHALCPVDPHHRNHGPLLPKRPENQDQIGEYQAKNREVTQIFQVQGQVE